MTVTGGVTFDELTEHLPDAGQGLLEGGVDVFLLETTQDTRNLKTGLIGIEQAFAEVGGRTPVMVSVTIEPMGTMLAGQASRRARGLRRCTRRFCPSASTARPARSS